MHGFQRCRRRVIIVLGEYTNRKKWLSFHRAHEVMCIQTKQKHVEKNRQHQTVVHL